MATYSADYLERLLTAVEDFERAFESWTATQVESDHLSSRGLFPTVWTREGEDEKRVRGLALEVAETAGAAAQAVAVTGAYLAVQGLGVLDPIANWSLMSSPKAPFTPSDIRTTAATVRGRLKTMLAESRADAHSEIPAFAPAKFHPVVWGAAASYWTAHKYRVAVREAAEGLTIHWKERLGRRNVDDTVFWQQTLAPGDPAPGQPKLVWPGEEESKTTKSMREGLGHVAKGLNALATGLNLTVRNVTTHTQDELDEQGAMERLAAYSYLAGLLDGCEVRRADPTEIG